VRSYGNYSPAIYNIVLFQCGPYSTAKPMPKRDEELAAMEA
jgi:hypothetical protein